MNKKTSFIIKVVFILFLPLILIGIKIWSKYPEYVENFYSTGFYQKISPFYRALLGWLPISIGDLLYTVAIIIACWKVYRFAGYIRYKQNENINVRKKFIQVFALFAIIYIYFNVAWGLNYNRLGIAHQLQLNTSKHEVEDLKLITSTLVQKVNACRKALGNQQVAYPGFDEVRQKGIDAFRIAEEKFPFLQYHFTSVKSSLYGKMGSYFGFLGYFNPFTGEAQVNLTQPKFLIPFVTCHEIAHQLGYASESEANFVGFLAASSSPDTLFRYSAYFDLFNYANRELYLRDTAAANQNYRQLDTLVKADRIELRNYFKKKDNYIEPLISLFYDNYLKANQQASGIKSYNEVVGLLVAFNKKFGDF